MNLSEIQEKVSNTAKNEDEKEVHQIKKKLSIVKLVITWHLCSQGGI